MAEVKDMIAENTKRRGKKLPVEHAVLQHFDSEGRRLIPPERLEHLFDKLKPFKLTKSELLQIADLAPKQIVELYLVAIYNRCLKS
eukprot:CAMPEP_0175981398 /NCGR_PEP_ID=MMETSP0108-20121206/47320_1 /TAXON_ID=195067 ORGANISM="Goniomonas pacifica, Strain CCMP1869" /NCGR_SAMPLE_ID=MMETSP0108 /ASSEMBLY_ACC=CAM_ASM_000204 /LENGTH=85 /DNA_ID=CAMNT_0017311937 /DNA_START=42 /DNA_END=299 /DNA_ORIENTATION=+